MVEIIFTWNHFLVKSADEEQTKVFKKTERYFEGESGVKVTEKHGSDVELEFWEDDELIKSFPYMIPFDSIMSLFKERLKKYTESEIRYGHY